MGTIAGKIRPNACTGGPKVIGAPRLGSMQAETTFYSSGGGADARSGPEGISSVGVICDYIEEGWPSMNLFGDMLVRYLDENHSSEIAAQQIRPAMRLRLSAIPFMSGQPALRNADRLINRYYDYPAWLERVSRRFQVFHIVDHSYSQLVLKLPAERTVVTCHDLDTFRCVLDPAAEPRPRWFQNFVRRTLQGFRRAAHVVAVSQQTKAQLLRYGLVSEDRITVIPPGVDPAYLSTTAPERPAGTSDRPALAGPYLLHVGSTIARKRVDVLLRVFAEVRKAFPGLRLLRVGGKLTPDQRELAKGLGLDGAIVEAPPLSKADLAKAYRGAEVLLQTSEAEGFGLPVIEALATGCAVVASDLPALREAGGTAAEYCGVGDIPGWAATVVRLLRERETSAERWETRRIAAERHASRFTWPNHVREMAKIYRRLAESGAAA